MKNVNVKKEWLLGYLFILPTLVVLLLFFFLPLISGLFLGFTDFNGFSWEDAHFVGAENFLKAFRDDYFTIALKNNFIFAAVTVPLTLIFGLLLALALDRNAWMSGVFKTICYFPNVTAWVAVALVWTLIFHPTQGPLNRFLMMLGISDPPGWIVSSKWALISIMIVYIWKNAGFYMIMFLVGLQNIPRDLYEACDIDGGSSWTRFLHVTWPLLSPTTFLSSILCIIWTFQEFSAVYIMTEGGPGRSTQILVYRIYMEAFRYSRFGYAMALSFMLFLIILCFTILQFWGQKKWVNYLE